MASSEPVPPQRIRERAYELWERHHRPEGTEMRFWLLAERELRAERERCGGGGGGGGEPVPQSDPGADPPP